MKLLALLSRDIWAGHFGCGLALIAFLCAFAQAGDRDTVFVRVSPRDPRYFELSDGRPFIPIGLNLIAPDGAFGNGEAAGLRRMDDWLQKLSTNGGNFARIWLSSPFWDIEPERSGVYDDAKAQRIDALLGMAQRHRVRLKFTLEHFREMTDKPRQPWANKPLHLLSRGGTATNVADFFTGDASRTQFRKKLAWLASRSRYPENPSIWGWELWNEVNAVAAGPDSYLAWTGAMLAELHRLFPRQLAMQSLGSFDHAGVRDLYRQMSLLPGNDVAQVHRYLDLGAALEVCHGPVDVLVADAVRELRVFQPQRPILVAESGAVEPGHSGPFKLYDQDRDGILLHDILFAPFFAGAAGAGQCWHWDRYVDRQNLWHHFARFAAVVKDLDPPAEHFEPLELPHPRLRVYALNGRHHVLLWCRDRNNTWLTELEQRTPPELLEGLRLDLARFEYLKTPIVARAYDPWKNEWTDIRSQERKSPSLRFNDLWLS